MRNLVRTIHRNILGQFLPSLFFNDLLYFLAISSYNNPSSLLSGNSVSFIPLLYVYNVNSVECIEVTGIIS